MATDERLIQFRDLLERRLKEVEAAHARAGEILRSTNYAGDAEALKYTTGFKKSCEDTRDSFYGIFPELNPKE